MPLSTGDRFCTRCGSRIPQGAAFCSSCGSAASAESSASAPPGHAEGTPYGYSGRRQEKQEKQEKHEKDEKNEKGKGGDLSGAITGGLILIWLGVTFFLQQNNYIPSDNWWAYFLMGIGAILILQGVIRLGTSRRPFVGSFIGGAVLLVIGLSFVQGYSVNLWPLIFVVMGVAIMLSAVAGRRRRPAP